MNINSLIPEIHLSARVRGNISIRLDPQVWQQGLTAGAGGQSGNACPYRPLTLASLSWHSGYLEGKAQRLKEGKA